MMTTGPERWSDEMSFVGGYEHVDQMPSHLLLDYSEKKKQDSTLCNSNKQEGKDSPGLVLLS